MLTCKVNNKEFTQFTNIFRTDTNKYTVEDIMEEIEEWTYILTQLLNETQSYKIDEIRFSSRLINCLAKTGRKNITRGYVTINENYLRQHSNPDTFHSTLAHETIHTLIGCFNHGFNFIQTGRKLMAVYEGLSINRTSADTGYMAWVIQNNVNSSVKPHTPKYKIVCEKCGQTFYRQRLSAIVKNPNNFRCGKCYGKFKIFEIMPDGMEIQRVFINL